MEPRKASVALLYNGKNATAQVSPYLASFTYTDVSSGSSDTISVELNDRDRKWIGPWLPQTGDRLKPTIRTQNWDVDNIKTSFLCGAFCVDDFSFKGNPINFYPRPPRGGRQGFYCTAVVLYAISIHALREEGD